MAQQATVREQPPTKAERYREIVATLARHGLGALTRHPGKEEDERRRLDARHMREACEELGTTFIKLGQALSTRADLLPDEYRVELAKLQDSVPPLPFSAIAPIIKEELGAPVDELFAFFDRRPMGSASIGQVHAATLHDGRSVVVKVRKPYVDELVAIDLEILSELVASWSQRWIVLDDYGACDLVEDFGDTLRNELDYTREAANVRFFAEFFQDDRMVRIPQVVDDRSTARVITLTRLEGTKPNEMESSRRRTPTAKRIARFLLEPAFSSGIFHADPHAGNFIVLQNGALGVLDFGMVGHLTPGARRRVADIFLAFDRRDPDRLTDRILQVTQPAHPVDRGEFSADVARLLERYLPPDLQSMEFGKALGEMLDLIREYRLRLPGALALLFKALVMCEGLLEEVDPSADLNAFVSPLANKLLYERLSGDDLAEDIKTTAMDAAELSMELPRRLDRVLSEVERGNLRVWARLEDLEPLMTRFERTVETVNAALLSAACIVGLAIVLLIYRPQGLQRWIGIAFWIVVALAFVFSLRTVWATMRKRKVR